MATLELQIGTLLTLEAEKTPSPPRKRKEMQIYSRKPRSSLTQAASMRDPPPVRTTVLAKDHQVGLYRFLIVKHMRKVKAMKKAQEGLKTQKTCTQRNKGT